MEQLTKKPPRYWFRRHGTADPAHTPSESIIAKLKVWVRRMAQKTRKRPWD